jgi:polar amino acid transport system substrate-binding protein
MRPQGIAGVLFFILLAGLAGGFFGAKFQTAAGPETPQGRVGIWTEPAYQRVMRTATLRCGYVVHPPHVSKDPATGAMTGAIVDVMNEAGKLLKIKVEWPEEVGWGNTVEALTSGRIDAICTDYWMNPVEGRYVGYSMPLFYETVMAYVRADDHRFDVNLEAFDDPAVTVAATDGSLSGIIAQQDFPKVKIASLANMTDTAQVLKEVDAGKADAAFVAAMDGLRFEQNNPGRLKNLTPDRPLRAFPATIALPQQDIALKVMLDSAFVQLLYSRFVDKTLTKHGMPADAVFRVARPYEVPPLTVDAALSGTLESVKP